GVVVLFGGRNGCVDPYVCGPANEAYGDTWEWDGSTWRDVSPAGGSPVASWGAGLAFDEARGVSVLFGGVTSSGYRNETWIWDGPTWTRRLPATSPPALRSLSMTFDSARARVVLAGIDAASSAFVTWEWNGNDWAPIATAHAPSVFEPFLTYDPSRR